MGGEKKNRIYYLQFLSQRILSIIKFILKTCKKKKNICYSLLRGVIHMIATEKEYQELLMGNTKCLRPIGGNCVGNCRKTDTNLDCFRPIGGNCVGNCRKSGNESHLIW